MGRTITVWTDRAAAIRMVATVAAVRLFRRFASLCCARIAFVRDSVAVAEAIAIAGRAGRAECGLSALRLLADRLTAMATVEKV